MVGSDHQRAEESEAGFTSFTASAASFSRLTTSCRSGMVAMEVQTSRKNQS